MRFEMLILKIALGLFDHLVGAENQRRWDAEVEGLCRL
jgi:hypothetical protein